MAEKESDGNCRKRGPELLHDPLLNKGTAFTMEERDRCGLHSLLPPRVTTIEDQVGRAMENYHAKPNDLEKYIFLSSLHDRNETLYYRLLLDHMEEMMPIVYTPTVGEACQKYGHLFRRGRGMFFSVKDRGNIAKHLENWPSEDVRAIVVTDGERILGLGDLGANGMGIPVGKLALYSACAGIDPAKTLPITLDVGTNNEELLKDPLYLGILEPRLRGQAYDDFIEEFIQAVTARWPKVLVQFEDFANINSFRLLERYRNRICTFNDDIQGTAAVVLSGLYSALRITGGKLAQQRLLFLGAGGAGVGIGKLIAAAMEEEGLSAGEARKRCWFMDSKGLVVKSRTDLQEHKLVFAHDADPIPDFITAIRELKPTAIVGVSGRFGSFTRESVEEMTRINERPIVFALSNPTSKAECTAEQAYTWSRGKAVFASGSPFDPVEYQGKTLVPGQGNNAYIFPGIGLGIVVSQARHVTDEMFSAAARALAAQASEADLAMGRIFPSLQRIREVSVGIATAVAQVAYDQGLARAPEPEDLESRVREEMFQPVYRNFSMQESIRS